MKINPKIDALQLMLTDLRTRNEPIRHKAAFKGCQPEFQSLVSRLIKQLEDELVAEKLTNRCLLYTSPSPRDRQKSRMPSSA